MNKVKDFIRLVSTAVSVSKEKALSPAPRELSKIDESSPAETRTNADAVLFTAILFTKYSSPKNRMFSSLYDIPMNLKEYSRLKNSAVIFFSLP